MFDCGKDEYIIYAAIEPETGTKKVVAVIDVKIYDESTGGSSEVELTLDINGLNDLIRELRTVKDMTW